MFASQRRRLTWAGYLSLVLDGVYLSAIGPGLPSIARRSHLPLAQAGTVLTAIFIGGLVTSPLAGRAMDRLGRRPLLIFGCAGHAAGCIGLAFAANWPQALASGALMGVGDSTLVVGYHVLFAELYPDESGAALNRLNVYFGIGALLGPALAAASLHAAGDIRYALWFVAAGQTLALAVLLATRLPAAQTVAHGRGLSGSLRALRRPLFCWLALLLALYVSLEIGVGNWMYTYLRGNGGAGLGEVAASILTSGYWLCLTLSRAVSPAVLRRLREPELLAVASVAALGLATLLLAGAGLRGGGAICILLLGLAFGPVWPLAFAVAAREFRDEAGAVSGLLTAAGSIGGLAGPWLQGVLLVQHGAYAWSACAFAGSLALACCAARVWRGAVTWRLPAGSEPLASRAEW